MKKLLVICGPTATGKTGLGLKMAQKYKGQIISADSRQIYKDMDIGTGKDLPKDVKVKSRLFGGRYYVIDEIKVWGYDLISPKKEFSVGHYIRFANRTIKNVWREGDLPILVGGTGLYIKGVVDGIDTAFVPRNSKLRKMYSGKSVSQLFEVLAQLDGSKAASLNHSDKNNSRRLIRAIEVASYKSSRKAVRLPVDSVLFIGLKESSTKLGKIIQRRVDSRIKNGFVNEVKKLLASGVTWKAQSMQALGYRQARKYLDEKESLKNFKKEWLVREKNYAKRQMVWFKKDKRINWYLATDKDLVKKVSEKVGKWIAAERKS